LCIGGDGCYDGYNVANLPEGHYIPTARREVGREEKEVR